MELPKKGRFLLNFLSKYLHIRIFCCTFAANFNVKPMLTAPTRESRFVPMSHNYESEVYYTREEFMDELAKQLGQTYGLNDIREAC